MSNLPVEDQRLISRYRAGVAVVESALSTLSDEDLDRSSGDEGWTARMVVHHLADSEARSYLRLRQLLVEPAPAAIQGYDEELWASSDVLGYETLPVGPSLGVFRAVRAASSVLLDRLQSADLDRTGVHSQSGGYSLRDWLRIYAEHAEDHAAQIARAASGAGRDEDAS